MLLDEGRNSTEALPFSGSTRFDQAWGQALMWLFLCHWYGSRNMVGQGLVDLFWAILAKPQVDLEHVHDIIGNVG